MLTEQSGTVTIATAVRVSGNWEFFHVHLMEIQEGCLTSTPACKRLWSIIKIQRVASITSLTVAI